MDTNLSRRAAVVASSSLLAAAVAAVTTVGVLALAGLPAEAAGKLTGRDIKNGSLKTKDLADATVAELRTTPPTSVGAAELRSDAVTGVAVADHSLTTQDVARFAGRFSAAVDEVPAGGCWAASPVGLAAEQAGADLRSDLVVVTPRTNWPAGAVSLTTSLGAHPSRFVLTICNHSESPVPAATVSFSYAVLDVP